MVNQFVKLWGRRELFSELFKAQMKLRHAGSLLGMLWTLINPFVFIATYYLVFTFFIKMGIPDYHLFLIPGFLAWNFTFTAIVISSESIIQSKYLIAKIAFPNEIITLNAVALPLFDFLISIILYILILGIFPGSIHISAAVLLLPVIIILQLLLTSGLGFAVSCLSVFFRDIPKLVQISGTVLFFLTPVFYPISNIPVKFQWIIKLNPMAMIVTFYHDIFYYSRVPDIYSLLSAAAMSMLIFSGGYMVFNHYKNSFAELT